MKVEEEEEEEEWKSRRTFALELVSTQLHIGLIGLEERELETTQVSVLPTAKYHQS